MTTAEETRGAPTFIVNVAPGAAQRDKTSLALRARGASVVATWPQIGVIVAQPGRGLPMTDAEVDRLVKVARTIPGVRSAGVSGMRPRTTSALPRVKAAPSKAREVSGDIAAHSGTAGPRGSWRVASGRGVTIGVADSGVFDEHEEVAGRFRSDVSGSCVNGGRLTKAAGSWRPTTRKDTHGTMVASVAAAGINGRGIKGIAPQASIASMKVVSDNGNIYPEAAICAAMWGVSARVKVVNHSYGIDWARPLRHQTMFDPRTSDHAAVIEAVNKAFAYSTARGVLNVAAMGNAGEDLSQKPSIPLPSSEQREGKLPARLVTLPAVSPGVVGVSESEANGEVTFMSNVGLGLTDISAPGAGPMASVPNTYVREAGTSFAAPAVSGAAALVWQMWPKATPAQVTRVLQGSARKRTCAKAGEIVSGQPCRAKNGQTNFFGAGLLDAGAAARAARTAAR